MIASIPDCVLESIYFSKPEKLDDYSEEIGSRETVRDDDANAFPAEKTIQKKPAEEKKDPYEEQIENVLLAQGRSLSEVQEAIERFRDCRQQYLKEGNSSNEAIIKAHTVVQKFLDGKVKNEYAHATGDR